MVEVTIPVHPLTRAALLSQYGAEPITVENHDILFDHLAGTVRRHATQQHSQLTADLSFLVDDDIARHLEQNGMRIGARLFRWHKSQLFWYAATAWRIKGPGHAKPALSDWLTMHGVDEDHYPVGTAFRNFQRWGKKIQDKNPHFFGQMRGRMTDFLPKKRGRRAKPKYNHPPLTVRMSDVPVELALGRFMAAVAVLFLRIPRRLEGQARVHLYMTLRFLSEREAADKLGITKSTVHYRRRAFAWALRKNPSLARLIAESADLPTPA